MRDRIMKALDGEIKKVVARAKTAQQKFQALMKDQSWVEEARKISERQGKEVRKLLKGDVTRVRSFLEKQRKEVEKIQKQIPGEVKKVREFVETHRKDIDKLLANLKRANTQAKKAAAGSSGGKATARKRKTKKSAG